MKAIKNFFMDEAGASAVEYALLVAVIAATLLGGVSYFYGTLQQKLNRAADEISGAS